MRKILENNKLYLGKHQLFKEAPYVTKSIFVMPQEFIKDVEDKNDDIFQDMYYDEKIIDKVLADNDDWRFSVYIDIRDGEFSVENHYKSHSYSVEEPFLYIMLETDCINTWSITDHITDLIVEFKNETQLRDIFQLLTNNKMNYFNEFLDEAEADEFPIRISYYDIFGYIDAIGLKIKYNVEDIVDIVNKYLGIRKTYDDYKKDVYEMWIECATEGVEFGTLDDMYEDVFYYDENDQKVYPYA